MLGQAPSTAMLTDLVTKANAGSTIQELADSLATNAAFTSSFPVWMTASEFTTQVVANVFAGGSVSAADQTAAVDYISGAITAGTFTKTSAVVALTSYLASSDGVANATYGSAAQSFQNKVEVAEYYTVTKGLGGGTDAELAAAISGVTAAADSVATSKVSVDDVQVAAAAAVAAANAPKSMIIPLTAAAETLTGGKAGDTFNAVLTKAGGTGTTILPGDVLDGGDGVDTLVISTSGLPTATYTMSAIQTSNIEKVMLNAFDTENRTDGTAIDMTLMKGVTEIGHASSGAGGDTNFTNVDGIKVLTINNGAGDVTVGYTVAALTGTATQTLNLSNVTAGTVTLAGVENVEINTSLVKSTLTDLVVANSKSVKASGDAALSISAAGDLDFKDGTATAKALGTPDGTFDASGLTGKLTVAFNASDNVVATGGSAADAFIMAAGFNGFDKIDGGDGIDTITMNAAALSTQFAQTSNVEVVSFNASAAGLTTDLSKAVGVSTVAYNVRDSADDGAVINVAITKADGKTISIGRTAAGAADVGNDDGVNYTISEATDSAADTANISLTGIGTWTSTNFGINTMDLGTYETINLAANTNATATVTTNEIGVVTATNATALNITGAGSLTMPSLTGAKLTSVDASGLAGALTLTYGASPATKPITYTMPGVASSITFSGVSNLNVLDAIVGGAGTTDSITATLGGLTAATSGFTATNVETINLTTATANALVMSNVTGAKTIAVTDNKQTITGLDLGATIALGTTTDAADTLSEIDVTATDATGTDDTLTVSLNQTAGGTNSIIDVSDVENLVLKTVAATNGVTLDLSTAEVSTITISEKAGTTAGAMGLGATHKNTHTISSTYKGALTVDLSANVAPAGNVVTFTGNGTAIQNVTGGGLADTFTIGSTAGVAHVISGGGGTDTANITAAALLVDVGSIDTENVNVTVVAGASPTFTTSFGTGVDAVTVTGGNTLSTMALGAIVDQVKTIDASGFTGKVTATLAANTADATSTSGNFTMTGGPLATDVLSYQITATGTDVIQTTGVETISVNNDVTSTISMASSDAALIIIDNAVAAKTSTISNLTPTQVVRLTASATDGVLVPQLADSTGATDTLTVEIKDSGTAIIAGANLRVDDVETLTIKASTSDSLDLSQVAMTTVGAKMTLNLTGTGSLTASAMGADINVIDASAQTTSGGFIQTGRSNTGTQTATGGAGADTFIMMTTNDVLTGGTGTDTLDINITAILGGASIDLTSTTDQVVSANGGATAGTVLGFENVDLSGYDGAFGAQVVGTKNANLVYGTTNADIITTGLGNDIVAYWDATADTVSSSGGTDSIGIVGGFTVANSVDFIAQYTGFDQVVPATGPSAGILNYSAHADAVTDGYGALIDFSSDTNATATNVINISALTSTAAVVIKGSAGVDQVVGDIQTPLTFSGGGGLDTLNMGTTGAATTVKLADSGTALAVNQIAITNFIKGEDKVDLSAIMAAATLTVPTQVDVDNAANQGAGATLITNDAGTDRPVYYLLNQSGQNGTQTLAQIETALAAGTAATGEGLVVVDGATNTLVYYDAALQTDAGSGAGLILVGSLMGVTGTTGVATGDFLSV
jgi:hypothetical protein